MSSNANSSSNLPNQNDENPTDAHAQIDSLGEDFAARLNVNPAAAELPAHANAQQPPEVPAVDELPPNDIELPTVEDFHRQFTLSPNGAYRINGYECEEPSCFQRLDLYSTKDTFLEHLKNVHGLEKFRCLMGNCGASFELK